MPESRSFIEQYFKEKDIMSVHLRVGSYPLIKRGRPGKWELLELIDQSVVSNEQAQTIEENILDICKNYPSRGSIEIKQGDTQVVQLDGMRIVIAKPPFADVPEITTVRQIVIRNFSDYALNRALKERMNKAEGIIVAGRPGEGKTTFAQALANYYAGNAQKIVKTLENPRDMQVVSQITRYGPLNGSMRNSANILLLVRPDYVIYDELRKTPDFKIYSDMRLAGVGMVGVIHASKPIDVVSRFLTRTEMGLLPQIVDTILFTEGGEITQVLSLEMTVKVPAGMTESDLARPVIVVRDYESKIAEYEIYTFGEQTVMIPLKKARTHRRRSKGRNRYDYREDDYYSVSKNYESDFSSKFFDVLDVRMGKKNVIFVLGKKARKGLVSLVAEDGTVLAAYIEANKKGEIRLHKSKAMKWLSKEDRIYWRFEV